MKNRKAYVIAIVTAFAVLINIFGRVLATKLSLPIWLDSFGTLLMAYAGGPVCGGIVGLSATLFTEFMWISRLFIALWEH